MLQYLKNHEIDRQKWDLCVNNSLNKLIYANTWFLDMVSPGWEAIVNRDYSAVMPIPVKSILGYNYVVQPLLAKQLGIFSPLQVSQALVQQFIEILMDNRNYIRLNVNKSTVVEYPHFSIVQKKNHELDLDKTYKELKKGYKRRTYLNLNRAIKSNINCHNNVSLTDFFKFAEQNAGYIKKAEYRHYKTILERIVNKAGDYVKVEVYGAYNPSDKMVSTGLFINDVKRKYFIFNVSDQEGIRAQSMYLLTDCFIQQHAGEKAILDFTGSDMKGVAYFLESFGAIAQKYQYIEYKKLPFPVNLMVR